MPKYRIALLSSKTNHELFSATMTILDALKLDAEYLHGEVGSEFLEQERSFIPAQTTELMKGTRCALFLDCNSLSDNIYLHGKSMNHHSIRFVPPLSALSRIFQLDTTVRCCSNRPIKQSDCCMKSLNLAIFKPNTHALNNADIHIHPSSPSLRQFLENDLPYLSTFANERLDDIEIFVSVKSRSRHQSLIEKAFAFAQYAGYPVVILAEDKNSDISKPTMLSEESRKIHRKYSTIEFQEMNIRRLFQWMMEDGSHDAVIVTPSLAGNIISEICRSFCEPEMACNAHIGDAYAIFMPDYESMPGSSCKPSICGIIRCIQMMSSYLQEKEQCKKLTRILENCIDTGNLQDMVQQILSKL